MKNIRIEVPALAENIRMIESFIDNVKEEFHLDDDIYGNIMIAVTEAVNNAIKHGSGNDSKKNVSLSLSLEDSTIRFRVEDQGGGFDYEHLPDPTAPENIEKPGGRGIFLMKNLADEVYFRDGGRTVELSFYMNA
ncbi:MAG: ATP-binding protein [Cyclobacteriaceae bacterium]|jgi:serine/threonine-protein kinase RsbW|nr:ATP-binding protein [Cytophagales bacterium]HNP75685.1 ATP-binding protein [Cyclobacteriaceae bacterium]